MRLARKPRSYRLERALTWSLALMFAALSVAAALDARREHMADESLPATCTIDGTDVEPSGAARFDAIIRFEATTPDGEPVGRYRMTLDAKGKTREQAQTIADHQREHQKAFACWYHPRDRDYLTLDPHGHWAFPASVAAITFLLTILIVFFARWERRSFGPDADPILSSTRWSPRSRIDRLYRARDFLPDEPPPGWSVAYALRDDTGWMLDAGDEGVLAKLEHEGSSWALKVYISSRGSSVPPRNQRCAEILGHLDGLGEWLECKGIDELPGTRVWLAIPRALRPRWKVPPMDAPPKAAVVPRLEAARRHLPDKLPPGWSVPVAITGSHGTDWKDGAWMFGVDDIVVMLNLWEVDGRKKLLVAMFHPDGEDVGEAEALDVLRHIRGVHEFSQGKRSPEAPMVSYLGEIERRERDRATLN